MSSRFLFLRGAAALLALAVPWSARGAHLLSASTCLQATSEGTRCAQPSDQIPWESPEVHAFVLVGEARPTTLVKVVWVSVDAIEPPNYIIQTDERKVGSAGGQVPLLFTIAKDEWPAGRYRIDLSVDGKAVRSLPFSVRKASADGRPEGKRVAKWAPPETAPPSATPPQVPPASAARTGSPPPAATEFMPAAGAPASPSPGATTSRETPVSTGSLAAVAALPPLTGSWVAQGPFGSLSLEFPKPGTLVLGGQSFTYTQRATALRVLEEGVSTEYPYTLREGVLTLQFPQGFSLAFEPAEPPEPTVTLPFLGSVPLPTVPSAPAVSSEALLSGPFCTEPLVLGPNVMGIRWCQFDGAGQFAFGQDNGLPYGRLTQGGGTYSLVGDGIQFVFIDGSLGSGRIAVRQPDGRVGSLVYGQLLYSGGLCP